MASASVTAFTHSMGKAGIPVQQDEQVLSAFAADASARKGAVPLAVVRPRTNLDVIEIVQQANQHKIPLIPVSSPGGPRRRGDTLSDTPCVIVDLSGLSRVMHADGQDAVAIIEAGVTFSAFAEALKPYGLRPYQPLQPRGSKSVLACFSDREPATVPGRQWDAVDPISCLEIVFGTGDRFRTGGAALPLELEESLALGNRQMYSPGPVHLDFARVVLGAQGALGILTWGSIYCQKVPAIEVPLFAAADHPEPLIDLCYKQLRRRGEGQIFILNNVQLALLLAKNAAHYAQLKAVLPKWITYLELVAPPFFPEEAIAYQRVLIDDDAAKLGLAIVEELSGVPASAVAQAQRSYSDVARSAALGFAESEAFCLSLLNRATDHIKKVAALNTDMDCAIYLQPMTHGVNAHCQFTFLSSPNYMDGITALSRKAAEALADSGGFLSRPHHPWADIPFQRDGDVRSIIETAKNMFDPGRILKPGAASLGEVV